MQFADRLQPLQSNVFADMDSAKSIAKAAGMTIIDLSLGSSDLPTDAFILEAIASALNEQPTIEQVEYQVIEKIETPTWDEVEVDTIALAKEAIAQPEIVEIALEGMTHAELKAIAKSEKIVKYYKMNKAQLVKAIAGINK